MKILVISGCSGRQKHKPLNKLQSEDFCSDALLNRRKEELRDYRELAVDMYTGDEHQYVITGLQKARGRYGRALMDLSIVSTGYGLLNESTVIVPYDVDPAKSCVLLKASHRLRQDLENLIAANYDLVFFLLGGKYYNALALHKNPFSTEEVPNTIPLVFLVGQTHISRIPSYLPNYHAVQLDPEEFIEFGGNRKAKGKVFKKLCEVACRDGSHIFEQVKQDPQQLLEIVRR